MARELLGRGGRRGGGGSGTISVGRLRGAASKVGATGTLAEPSALQTTPHLQERRTKCVACKCMFKTAGFVSGCVLSTCLWRGTEKRRNNKQEARGSANTT